MEGLGINWKILLGQIVNFAIIFFLLKKFVFSRFSDTLQKRKNAIESGLKKSEEAEQNLSKIRSLEKEIRLSSEEKAKEIIKTAQINSEKNGQEILAAAEVGKEKILLEAREMAAQELKAEKEKQKKETIEMSVLLAEKFLKEKFDSEKDKKLLEDLASDIKES